ncbi:MAG: helix-hairpin-helix domain-containing protein [Betaproteobacteria bacterium]|nr:helix-hairpin-helix domain-containing protein [Betaproteobacteria bacterium]
MPRVPISIAIVSTVLFLGSSHAATAQQPQGTKPTPSPTAPQAKAAPAAKVKLVDINSASRAELMTLPGIGDAEAARIIAARPYPSKAKLAADKVLSMEAYAALKGRIVAVQKAQPKAKPKAKPAMAPASTPAGKS